MSFDLYLTINAARLASGTLVAVESALSLESLSSSRSLCIHFDQLGFVDSSGLGFLVKLRNQLQGPKLVVLEGIKEPAIIELFELTRMDQLFLLSADKQQSLALIDQYS